MFNTIRSKLLFSFTLFFLITVGLGTVTYFFTRANNHLVDQAVQRDFNGSMQISELAILAQKIRRYEKEYFMYIGNAKKQAKYEKEWGETFAKIQTRLNGIRSNRSGLWRASDWFLFDKWAQSLNAYGDGFRNVIADVNAGKLTDTLSANSAIQDAKNAFRVMVNGTIELANKKYQGASVARQNIKTKSAQLNLFLLATLGTAALLCLVLIVSIPRVIIKPIKQLSTSASAMSQGDLETPVPVTEGVKDFDELVATLERMRISQKAMLKRMTGSAVTAAA